MSRQTRANSLSKSTQQQQQETNEIEISTNNLPHFDFVVPAYGRDRRLSSITSTVLPETLLNTISGNVSFSSVEQNVPSTETENNNDNKGSNLFYFSFIENYISIFYSLVDINPCSLEQMVSYRRGQHVEDKALSRNVR